MATLDVVSRQSVVSDSRIVLRNTAVQALRYAAIWGANVALVLFLPRYLGDQGLGQLQFAISFVSLFSFVVALGVRHYLIKEVARDRLQLAPLLGAALSLRVVMAMVALVLIAIAVEVSGRSGAARHVVYLAMLWMVITSFAQLLAAALHGLERMGWASFSEVVNKILVVAVGVALLTQGGGVRVYAAVMVVGSVVHLLMNMGYAARYTSLRVDFHWARMKSLAMGGGPYVIMGFLLGAYMHTDVVMLQFFTDEAVVGWHAAALQIYRSVEFLPMVLTAALLPTLSRLHVSNVAAVAFLARKGLAAMVIIIAPVGVGLSLTAEELIAFFPYPDEFTKTVPVLTVMALSTPVTALLTVLGTIAISMDRQRMWAIALTVTVLLNVVLNLALIPYTQAVYGNGAVGAALATLATELLMVGFGVAILPRLVFEKGLLIVVAKVTVAATAMGVAVYGAKSAGLGLWPLVAIGAVIYAASVLALRAFDRRDMRLIREGLMHRSRSSERAVGVAGEL